MTAMRLGKDGLDCEFGRAGETVGCRAGPGPTSSRTGSGSNMFGSAIYPNLVTEAILKISGVQVGGKGALGTSPNFASGQYSTELTRRLITIDQWIRGPGCMMRS